MMLSFLGVSGQYSPNVKTCCSYQAITSLQPVVPLIFQQELIAVLWRCTSASNCAFGEVKVQLVVIVADQAALALSQARAYGRISALK